MVSLFECKEGEVTIRQMVLFAFVIFIHKNTNSKIIFHKLNF